METTSEIWFNMPTELIPVLFPLICAMLYGTNQM